MADFSAYKTINLLEDKVYPLGFWDKVYIWVVKFGRHLLMLVEIATVLLFVVHVIFDERLIKLKERINRQAMTLEKLRLQEDTIRYLANVLSSIKKLDKNRFSMYELNSRIYSLLPSGIFLEQVSINQKDVTLSGKALNYETIRQMTRNIKDSPLIDGQSIRIVTNQKTTGDVMFELSFKFL